MSKGHKRNIKKVSICLLFVCSVAWPLDITGFKVKKCSLPDRAEKTATRLSCRKADIIFSKAFLVRDIKLMETPVGKYIQMPLTVRKHDRKTYKYSNIKIDPKVLYDNLIKAFDKNIFAVDKAAKIDYEVTSARSLRSDSRVANVDVTFDGQLIVTFGLLREIHYAPGAKVPVVYFTVSNPQNFEFKSKKLERKVSSLVRARALEVVLKKDALHK